MSRLHRPDRRTFLGLVSGGALGLFLPRRPWPLSPVSRPVRAHPEPRVGYTAAKVPTAAQLGGDKELIALFDGVRAIPQVVDGIRCKCGCADLPDFYSLISCYEGESAMAKWCPICQGIGALAVRLHGRGQTLDQIREAVDARY